VIALECAVNFISTSGLHGQGNMDCHQQRTLAPLDLNGLNLSKCETVEQPSWKRRNREPPFLTYFFF